MALLEQGVVPDDLQKSLPSSIVFVSVIVAVGASDH